jgi:drug/metabolite transporter (DMT)-like permease
MNKPRLIWGIICLTLAVLIGVLIAVLPPGTITLMVEGTNRPWVAAAVLGILGIVLLVSAARYGSEAEQPVVVDEEKAALNKRLETMAWGCFLILLGGFLFVPEAVIKGGWWSIGVGLIMLGLNAARYFSGLRMSGSTTILGFLSVTGGVLDLAGIDGIDGAILLIVLGGYLIVKPWIEKRGLFGKAEQA